jgi:hypothetical protein
MSPSAPEELAVACTQPARYQAFNVCRPHQKMPDAPIKLGIETPGIQQKQPVTALASSLPSAPTES